MRMQLIILESIAEAKAVAKAFGESLVRTGKYTAKTGHSPSLLFWRGGRRLLANAKKPALSEQMEEDLTALMENEDIDNIICALFPTKTSVLFADCIRRRFEERGISVFTAVLTSLKKEDVLRALEHAEKVTAESFEVIRATGERHNAFSLAGALGKIIPCDPSFDLAMLAALYLIDERESLLESRRFRLETEICAGERAVPLFSEACFTEAQAQQAAEALGKKLFLLPAKAPRLPDAVSLSGVYDGFAPKGLLLRDTAVSLFEKGYITNPFTLSGSLPKDTDAVRKAQIIAACRTQHPGEERLEIGVLERFESGGDASAVFPLKDSTSSLDPCEAALFQKLISLVKDVICEETSFLRFLDKKTGLVFSAPSSDTLPRGGQSFPLEPAAAREDGTFQSYAPGELMEELRQCGLDSCDVILTLLSRLFQAGAVYSDTLGLHLSPKGAGIIRSFPASKDTVLALFRATCSRPDSLSDTNAHLVRISNEVNRAAAAWLSAAENGARPREEKEVPCEVPSPAEAPLLLPCPFCGKLSMTEQDRRFVCGACGAVIENPLRIDDASFTLTEKDILVLAKEGRTKYKRGRSDAGKLSSGGYLTLEGGVFRLSHKSAMRCPHCRENLLAYAWGFSCPSCRFGVPFEVYRVRLKTSDLKKLLAGKQTDPIKNLISKQGEVFTARLSSLPGGKIRTAILKEE